MCIDASVRFVPNLSGDEHQQERLATGGLKISYRVPLILDRSEVMPRVDLRLLETEPISNHRPNMPRVAALEQGMCGDLCLVFA